MSMTSPDLIELDPVQRQRLRHLIRAGTTAQQLVERARIVMLAAQERVAESASGFPRRGR